MKGAQYRTANHNSAHLHILHLKTVTLKEKRGWRAVVKNELWLFRHPHKFGAQEVKQIVNVGPLSCTTERCSHTACIFCHKKTRQKMRFSGAAVHEVTIRNVKCQLEGYYAPTHCAVEVWNCILWHDGAPTNTLRMSWSCVCDPELITQHLHLTSLMLLRPNAIKSLHPTSNFKPSQKSRGAQQRWTNSH